jgi:hypothetical protein
MVSSLPLEVVGQIIDYVSDDLSPLHACALVHSSWTPACHRHLFHTIQMVRPSHPSALVALLKSRPHPRPLIRCLHWEDWVLHDSDFDLHRPELVSELFPRVRSLRFDGLHLHWPTVLGLLGLEELQLGSITRVIDAT